MFVSQILSVKGRKVVSVNRDATLAEAVDILMRNNIGAVLVLDEDGMPEGILSERDIVRDLALHGSSVLTRHVSDVMTPNVVTCSVGDSVNDLMSTMTAKRIRHLPVVDRGRLCGVISIGDVVKYRLEEVESEANAMREYIATG